VAAIFTNKQSGLTAYVIRDPVPTIIAHKACQESELHLPNSGGWTCDRVRLESDVMGCIVWRLSSAASGTGFAE
jgi:hypothetical protein